MTGFLSDATGFQAAAAGTGTFTFGNARADSWTLAQAQTAGRLTDGMTVSYFAQDSLTNPQQREWGHGTYSLSGNSIARTTVLGTVSGGTPNSSGSPLNFTTPPYVFLTALAEDIVYGIVVPGTSTTVLGGGLASSTLTLESTSGAGTSDAILFKTGSQVERVRIDSSGQVTIGGGANTFGALFEVFVDPTAFSHGDYIALGANTAGATHFFLKTRATTPGTQTAVLSGDGLGALSFRGSDGTAFRQAATITAAADVAPATSTTPGRITFSTTPAGTSQTPIERLRIDSNAQVAATNVAFAASGIPLIAGAPVVLQAVSSNTGYWELGTSTFGNAISGGWASFVSRGTQGSRVAAQSGDILWQLWNYGDDGSGYIVASVIESTVTATPTPGNVSARLSFFTADTSGGIAERVRIKGSGLLSFFKYTNAYLYVDGSSNVASVGVGHIIPGHDGIVGDGSTNDSAAIASFINSFSEIVVTAGTYNLVTAENFASGRRITFQNGAKFLVNATIDFSGSVVDAPIDAQIFTFGGGNVNGLSRAYPEWFGAKRDGSTDDSSAINRMFTALTVNRGISTPGTNEAIFSPGIYALSNQVVCQLGSQQSFRIRGAGTYQATGTLILGLSGAPNEAMFVVQGNAGVGYDLECKDLQFQNQSASLGFSSGFYLGKSGSPMGFGRLAQTRLFNLASSGFRFANFYLQNCSSTFWDCCFTNPFANDGTKTTGNTHFYYSADTSGQAGMVMRHCQFDTGDGSSVNLLVTDNGGTNAGTGGVRIESCDFYTTANASGRVIWLISGGVGGSVGDIWITDCEFESQTPNNSMTCIQITAQSGGIVSDVHIRGNYIASDGWNHHLNAQATDTSSTIRDLFFSENYCLSPYSNAVLIQGPGSLTGHNLGFVICNNQFVYTANNSSAIIALGNGLDGAATIMGNNGHNLPGFSPSITGAGVDLFGPGGNKATVVGNNMGTTTATFVTWTNTQNSLNN